MQSVVIALGGNALVKSKRLDYKSQQSNVSKAVSSIVPLLPKYRIVITHGNGPQVGASLIRHRSAAKEVPPFPLYVCVAETQGSIGYMIQTALENYFFKRKMDCKAVTVITRSLVGAKELSRSLLKPIGPYYSKEELMQARKLRPSAEFRFFEGYGYRLMVHSPQPKEILEADIVAKLVNERCVPIACGGGGIPVANVNDEIVGVETVIDKDLASALLANAIRADIFVSLTDVEGAYLKFGSKNETLLKAISLQEIRKHYRNGEFAEGSMAPKVLACMNFLEGGGRRATIAHIEKLELALVGKAGTQITT